MLTPFATALSLALCNASLQPTQVPAKGTQEAVLTLDHAAMIALSAESSSGTSCTLIDKLRGPFASNGSAGRDNCKLNLLLDPGAYKLRLDTPESAKGKVTLKAVPFTELNATSVQLLPNHSITQTIHPGQQASFWIHIDRREVVNLRVLGRTSGRVELWHNGEWREDVAWNDERPTLRPGQNIHDIWATPTLEAGDHLLTVYGTNAESFAQGEEIDQVLIAYGMEAAPAEGIVQLTLPALGRIGYQLPGGRQLVRVERAGDATGPVEAQLFPIDNNGQIRFEGHDSQCTITAKQLVPECVASSNAQSQIVWISGPPGTQLNVRWGPYGIVQDGAFTSVTQTLEFVAPSSREFIVSTQDLGADADSAPLSCELEHLVRRTNNVTPPPEVVADDFLQVSTTKPFARRFNYGGSSETIWFHVADTSVYRVVTQGERKSACELFRIEGADRTRVGKSAPGAESCDLRPLLGPGSYELRLYGGNPGIERLSIGKGTGTQPETNTKSNCLFKNVQLERDERYRVVFNRTGSAAARGLVLRALPTELTTPLPLRLEPSESIEVPLIAGGPVQVIAPLGGKFQCSLGDAQSNAQGHCELSATTKASTLVLSNPGTSPVELVASRPEPKLPEPPTVPFSPRPDSITEIAPGKPHYFDFERNESHSVVFDVREAGFYDVTTDGLLATACSMRTTTITRLATSQGGGRGRNCLLASYLREGRYLLTVNTVGTSRGRAGVELSKRTVRDVGSLSPDGQVFFHATANEPVREKLVVGHSGSFILGTVTQAGKLQCRLEDKDGWPLVQVPTPCREITTVRAGTYEWMQLPLTVGSMRHTSFEKVHNEPVLSGTKPHSLELNHWYTATLSKKGLDDFRFHLDAELDVHFALTNGMQGRLSALAPDGTEKPVEFIAAESSGVGSAPAPAPAPGVDEGVGDDSAPPAEYEQPQPEPVDDQNDGNNGANNGDEGGDGSQYSATPVAAPPARPEPATGVAVHLVPGNYKLVTQHSRGDKEITYQIRLGVDSLAPGVSLTVNAPARMNLRVPRDGTLRLRTVGDTDVRCRIFDAQGHKRFEVSDNGDDWNCAMAEPFRAGDYELVIESETQVPGVTTVSASMPPVDDVAELKDGQELKVGEHVALGTLPVKADAIEEVLLRSTRRFSCALESASGASLHRENEVTTCTILARTGKEPLRVRVWTLEQPATVKVSFTHKPIHDGSAGVASGTATRVNVPRPGRFETGRGVYCLPDGRPGALQPCGPDASLDAGQVLFAVLGTNPAKLPMSEEVASLEKESKAETLSLDRAPFIQAQQSSKAIQWVRVYGRPGEHVAPACRIDGGIRVLTSDACYAVSTVTDRSVLRLWAPTDEPVEANVKRAAVIVPSKAESLSLGHQEHALNDGEEVARLRAPDSSWQSEFVLAAHAGAVQFDSKGEPIDLCPPLPPLEEGLNTCRFEGKGGEVIVYTPKEARFETNTVQLESAPPVQLLSSLFETRSGTPGSLRLRVDAAASEREIQVEGAERCSIRLDDGTRQLSCNGPVPAGQSAVVVIEQSGGSLRAILTAPGAEAAARFGALPTQNPTPLAASTATALSGSLVQHSVALDHDSVLHLRSSTGTCAIANGATLVAEDGLAAGCDLYQLLKAGTYRVVVRHFADQPLTGTMSWNADAVEDVQDGVGPERWIAPGQARFFRFQTASAGQVGIGLQAAADRLECQVFDARQQKLGDGCQQFLSLPAGQFVLEVRAPERGEAMRFRAVVLGLAGARMDVPDEYLRNFFTRIGAAQ